METRILNHILDSLGGYTVWNDFDQQIKDLLTEAITIGINGSQLGLVNINGNNKKIALDIMNEWNDFAGKYNLNRVLKITDKRISNVNQRLAETDFNICHIFQRIEESDFLQGKNKEGWKVDFDFIFGSKNNWVKIMEGKYATNKTSGGATPEELRAIVQRRADREQAGDQSL